MINFKDYLTKDILPFWLNNAIDEQNGGIFTQLERSGTVYGTEKSVWFQGRALWVFSKAYNFIEKNEAYLHAAKKIYNFLPKCTDTDGRMFFTVTKEGSPIQKRRYYFSETFAAIGCAQYFKATGEVDAWTNAKKYYFTAKNCYDNPSLNPPKLHIKAKAHSPVMIMIATSRSMAECAPTAEEKSEFSAYARKFTEEFLNGGFISNEANAVLETVGVDGAFINTPLGRVVNPGHGLETAWFLMIEGLIENNEKALAAGKKIIDITMPIGLDTTYGGIISFTDALGKPPTALEWNMKLWWPQCEAILANKLAYQIFGENKYQTAYENLLAYAFKHFADTEFGEWFGYLNYDSTLSTTLKGNIFKGPFHLPRMLMILWMIEQGDFLSFFR